MTEKVRHTREVERMDYWLNLYHFDFHMDHDGLRVLRFELQRFEFVRQFHENTEGSPPS